MARPKLTQNDLTIREQAQITTNAEENKVMTRHSLNGLAAQPVDLLDTEAVERRTMEYITDCMNTGTRVTPPGLALWLGINSADLKNWLTEIGTEEHRKAASRIYQFLHAAWADVLMGGKISPSAGMFLGKNWFGYREEQRIETAETVEKVKTLDELQKEAEALPEITIIETQKGGRK